MTRSFNPITPSMEQRLSGWIAIQERLGRLPEVRVRPTITLSRQFGCEGFPLAESLQKAMEAVTGEGWTIHDKSLIEKVSQDEAIPLRILKNLGDRSQELEALGLMPSRYRSHDEAFEKVARCLVPIAEAGDAIIVGRGGAVLCEKLKNCFHFRLVADLGYRVESVMRRMGLSRGEAEALVNENNHLREKFISDRLGVDIADPCHYDAVFNNARHGIPDITEAILAYVRKAWPEPGLFR